MTKIICFVFSASLAQAASFDITQYGGVGNGTHNSSWVADVKRGRVDEKRF